MESSKEMHHFFGMHFHSLTKLDFLVAISLAMMKVTGMIMMMMLVRTPRFNVLHNSLQPRAGVQPL